MAKRRTAAPTPHRAAPVYVVSGGSGSSGELLVHTALAQFADRDVPVVLVPRVRRRQQLTTTLRRAAADGGSVAHTLVDARLRRALVIQADRYGVPTLDLIGPLLAHLQGKLRQPPVGKPGLYRHLHEAYFKRVAAVDFAMHHDDGLRPDELAEAEIVLLGVSRLGKTPLTMYLAIQGWKVANVPLAPGLELPAPLPQLPRQRLIGLTIDARQLAEHRCSRQEQMHHTLPPEYTELTHIRRELAYAAAVYEKLGLGVVDVTQKPIETTAEEIVTLVGRAAGLNDSQRDRGERGKCCRKAACERR